MGHDPFLFYQSSWLNTPLCPLFFSVAVYHLRRTADTVGCFKYPIQRQRRQFVFVPERLLAAVLTGNVQGQPIS
jgi:hypothetical protein